MKSLKILYVEDYPVIQTMYTDVLRAKGFEVDSVSDGKAALAKVSETDYDIILLDLLLPNLTGTEFLHAFAKEHKLDNIVVLTDFDKPETVNELKSLGIKHYWIKVENTPHMVAGRLESLLNDKEKES